MREMERGVLLSQELLKKGENTKQNKDLIVF